MTRLTDPETTGWRGLDPALVPELVGVLGICGPRRSRPSRQPPKPSVSNSGRVLASEVKHPRCWHVDGTSQVDVKGAAQVAKAYIIDLFADEHIQHGGLEEVKFNQGANVWDITIGFSRPWDRSTLGPIIPNPAHRSYKMVRINDKDGEVMSVAHRALTTTD